MEREKLETLLEQMDDGDERAERELLDYIMRQPEGIRVLAFEALERGGDDTREQLILTLADDPSLVIRSTRQRRAQEQIPTNDLLPATTSASSSRTLPPDDLLTTLRVGERSRRIQAARALSQYKDAATIGALIEGVRSGDKQVAAAAVESLQTIGKPATSAIVAAVAQEGSDQARWSLIKVLSSVGDESAVPPLVRALEDSNYGTRWLAAEGLARIGRLALVPLLRRLTEGKPTAWLKDGAWHALNKISVTDGAARDHYRQLGTQIKQTSTANLPHLAREELRRLGEDA